jgi:hypothetical protein
LYLHQHLSDSTSTLVKFKKKLWHSRDRTAKHTQTIIDATQKEAAVDQQQHSCKTLICQRHQTAVRFLSTVGMTNIRWRVRELYCQTTYILLQQRSPLPLTVRQKSPNTILKSQPKQNLATYLAQPLNSKDCPLESSHTDGDLLFYSRQETEITC